jgi:hypothetical protein
MLLGFFTILSDSPRLLLLENRRSISWEPARLTSDSKALLFDQAVSCGFGDGLIAAFRQPMPRFFALGTGAIIAYWIRSGEYAFYQDFNSAIFIIVLIFSTYMSGN